MLSRQSLCCMHA